MNHKACNQGQYELALEEGSFKRLLPYPCKLVLWQMHHPADSNTIGKIGAHIHGLAHYRCGSPVYKTHPKPHGGCGDKCKTIDGWMRKTLTKHLLGVLVTRTLPQQKLI